MQTAFEKAQFICALDFAKLATNGEATDATTLASILAAAIVTCNAPFFLRPIDISAAYADANDCLTFHIDNHGDGDASDFDSDANAVIYRIDIHRVET